MQKKAGVLVMVYQCSKNYTGAVLFLVGVQKNNEAMLRVDVDITRGQG